MLDKLKGINSIFTVDCVIFGFDGQTLNVLLIERGEEPYEGAMAVPGDFGMHDEDLDAAAYRVLSELTGLRDLYMEQAGAFGGLHRHPWGRIITVSYYSLINIEEYNITPASFAKTAQWYPVKDKPPLAFDHDLIFEDAYNRLREKIQRYPIGFELLPRKFPLSTLQNLYEAILDIEMDKRNFRRKILKMNILQELDEKQEGVAHRAATLYEFDPEKYERLKEKGNSFEI
ncbi:MAG: NUDIX domain-containing protein [Chitinophagales bacterium]|nr:NUDIX hydrolase [Bacteroidota bacterium]MCB9042659.1 NUDIX hydrolase [Chitinophagales bacterium]